MIHLYTDCDFSAEFYELVLPKIDHITSIYFIFEVNSMIQSLKISGATSTRNVQSAGKNNKKKNTPIYLTAQSLDRYTTLTVHHTFAFHKWL